MSSDILIALASLLTALGAAGAAVVAAYALRAQQRGEQRQHDLENLRWLSDQWKALGPMRRRAAKGVLAGTHDHYALREVLNFFESTSFLVRERFMTENTFAQISRISVVGWWHAAEPVVREARLRVSPDLYDHMEWLAERMRKQGVEPDGDWVDEFLRREADLPIFEAKESAVGDALSG